MLEKPISPNARECLDLQRRAEEKGTQIMVCHVMRYTKFYRKLKELIDSGVIGDVVHVTHTENVAYWHYAHSYVRGNWHKTADSSPMILAKCCHDMDILSWLLGSRCRTVSSFGDLRYFREENAPAGSPARCTDGCPHSGSCPYYAPALYLDDNTPWPTALTALGPDVHVVAVCQPGPPVLAAASLMAEDKDPNRPASMTFMGSPIDARLSPTVTNQLAEEKPFAWFKSNMIDTVPAPYPGMGRRVYPGFVQLYSFMSMNIEKHQDAHLRYLEDLMKGDGDAAEKHLEFYDEYLSVLDLPEEFYLQTIDYVFQQYLLPKGELVHRGRPIQPGSIRDIGLLTVEGENDDISGIGQTQAAHTLCTGLSDDFKEDYVQPHVGHYGVFNGRRFREEIYPRVRAFIRRMEGALEKARDAA